MKKAFIISALMLLISISTFLNVTNASNNQDIEFSSMPKVNNELFGYFMLDLYHKEITNYIKDYYKDENIKGYSMPNPESNKPVFITTSKNLKDVEEQFSYVLKTTILPTDKDGTIRGKDTLTFAVEPSRVKETNLSKGLKQMKLIKYEHEEVKK